MRFTALCAAVTLAATCSSLAQADGGQAGKANLDDAQSRLAYAFGMQAGKRARELSRRIDRFDMEAFLCGVRDSASGTGTMLSEQEALKELDVHVRAMDAKRQEAVAALTERNTVEGKAFLETNARKDGVTVTDSGLQYEVLKQGKGPMPTLETVVEVHCRGTFLDGTPFMDTYKNGTPRRMQVKDAAPAWAEALQLMSIGSKYRVYAPPELAADTEKLPLAMSFGGRRTVVFELELVEILDRFPNLDKNAPEGALW